MRKASTLSTPVVSLKFPPITAMSHSTGRAKDWDDIITAHSDEGFARSWSLLAKKHGKHSFKFDMDEKRKGPPIGLIKVLAPVHVLRLHCILMSGIRIVRSGCMRFCMWKLLFGEYVKWVDKHVEYAVWVKAEEIRRWALPSRRVEPV